MFEMTTTSFRVALGTTIVFVLAAASGATILVTHVVKGDSGFGILTGAATLLAFGVLAVRSWRNALRLRREGLSQGAQG
ncbi:MULTISPECIES: hypothetical protein [unclassified Microbacterium]|uniref:hypothetical protein n=1 Tax=unclassified Microbacterium TaxID=2609290 RepID=UPI00214B8AC8|nr:MULTISPECIES: hypothetical protein [unclassified Microbacterium]MCR2785842.1 hypothetical protein [Microbacterium sp. zg.B96]MDL5350040.1 hypothetical protein [Microbacterium sp. zg-YB36]WIM17179.1 hypothetical protein QNO11_05965 [Microbacterium sp. zg-B96]